MSPTGHLAVGFAAKKFAPKIPLLVFLIVPYALDLIYFIFVGVGIESVDYSPWSHSLLMALVWSALALLITLALTNKFKNGLVIGLVLLSHWVLDFVVWNDMLITFDKGLRVGLGLYNAIGFTTTSFSGLNSATLIASSIELSLLMFGVAVYILYLRKMKKESFKSGKM